MTKLYTILFLFLLISCSTTKESGLLPEDELFVTRKYVGNFIEYKYTSKKFGEPPIMYISTTQDSIYNDMSIYSRECQFKKGEQLYLRRVYIKQNMWGSWEYQLENNNDIVYRISGFKYGQKMLVQDWF